MKKIYFLIASVLCLGSSLIGSAENFIYYMGSYSGWDTPVESNAEKMAPFRLFETSEGSNVYSGVITNQTGYECQTDYFRFYKSLAPDSEADVAWGLNIIAPLTLKPTDLPAPSGYGEALFTYVADNTHPEAGIDMGGGTWTLLTQNKPVEYTLDFNTNQLQVRIQDFEIKEYENLYFVGQPGGWVEPKESNAEFYKEWQFTRVNTNQFYGEFEVAPSEAMFRFYTALNGWETDSFGSQEYDEALCFDYVPAPISYKLVAGKGPFKFVDWPGGTMRLFVDMDALYMVMNSEYSGISNISDKGVDVMSGRGFVLIVAERDSRVSIVSANGAMVYSGTVSAGTTRVSLAPGIYFANGRKLLVK